MSKRPYRVLLINLTKAFGGADVRVLATAQALQEHVDACAVVALENSDLHRRLQAEGLPHHVISVGRGDPRTLWQLRQLMKAGSYQIADAHTVQSILWGHFAAWLAGVHGRVSTINSDYGKEYPGLKGKIYEGVLKITRRLTRQYINVTEVLQQKSETSGDAHRSTLIPNAVPVPSLPLQHKFTGLYGEWGFESDDFVIGIIARLKPVKGHQYLIDAIAQLDDLQHVKLLIVGTGPLDAELREQVESLGLHGRVHFTGFREDVLQIMQSIDCMCVASLSEALPYVVLEAASYARPILATAVGGLISLLEDKQTAVMALPQDPASLANGIRWIVSHPEERQQIGLNAYNMVKQSFSTEAMIDAVLQVYDRALA